VPELGKTQFLLANTVNIIRSVSQNCENHARANRYNNWLRAGRPRDRSLSSYVGKNFHFSISSKTAPRPTQPHIYRVLGALSPELKRPWREADHSPLTSAKVKKTWVCTSTPPYTFMAYASLVKHRDKYLFIYISMALQPFVGPWPLFQFLNPIHNR
jgi:hypothetical protein